MISLPAVSISKITGSGISKKVLALLTPICAIIVSIIVLAFIFWPRLTQVIKLKNENQQLLSRSTSLEVKASKLAALDVSLLKLDLAAAEQLLPSDKAVFALVVATEKAAASSGVLLNRVEVLQDKSDAVVAPVTGQDAAASTLAPKIQLKVAITSDYRSLVQFLGNTLALPRAVGASEFTINSATSGGGQVKVLLTIDGYWQALPAELPAIESPIEDLTSEEQSRLTRITSSGLGVTSVPTVAKGRSDLFASF